jgi:hypothetical protein
MEGENPRLPFGKIILRIKYMNVQESTLKM